MELWRREKGESVYMECSGWLHAQLFEAFPWRPGPVEVQVLALGAREPRYHLFFFFFHVCCTGMLLEWILSKAFPVSQLC